ncbi:hypothetical protein [Endozoicomonas lisbonensis]|uniref:ABC-type uncharacterized transport system auxiliary subunit n=1 Tax=Endozoicomonas lisbonensis TaxID=3120522 RepID=A0ABV2SCW2_9GAMM
MKNYLYILLLSLFLTGCAAKINKSLVDNNDGTTRITSESKILLIQTLASERVKESRNISQSISELNDLVVRNINQQKPQTVIILDQSLESNIGLNLSIERFRYVSSIERFMTGVILGDAAIKIRAEIVDSETGKIINQSIFDTESETIQGVFGATTPRQLEAIAEAIADYYITSVSSS